ncbi:MAG: zf-TFIIB domain-containing protein [Alphaproteobacteria bacterium]|nr:zf-TFIIB domain-containing protein [Alphaproteobacteria bacterium]
MTRACPACSTPMKPYEAEPGLVVDTCAGCRGMWLDKGELARLRAAPQDLPEPKRALGAMPGPLSCPVCPETALLRFAAVDGGPELDHCRRCGGVFLDAGELGPLRQLRAPARPRTRPRSSRRPPPPPAPARFDAFALAPLIGLPLGLLLHLAGLELLVAWFSAWFHELGHSWVAWCAGYKALPLVFAPGLAWASMSAEPSLLVALCFGFLNGVSVFVGVGRRQITPLLLGLAGWAGQLWFGALATEKAVLEAISWAGVAGELIGPTLLLLAAYHALPPRFHWDALRWPAAIIAGACLVTALGLWVEVASDPSLAPWGTGIGGRGDSGGDLNQLRDIHGWTVADMTRRATRLGWAGLLVILAEAARVGLTGRMPRPWEISSPPP